VPSGNLFMRVQSFVQDPGNTFGSKSHQSGFLYVSEGVERQLYADGETVDLHAGEAYFQRSAAHSHSNPGNSANHWYFISVWPSAARGAPPVSPVARVVFDTQDLPAHALAPGASTQIMRLASLDPGGRAAAHKHGGLELLFVLTGSITVHAAGESAVSLGPGQATWHAPGTVVQETNPGNTTATYLLYIVTADGQPFETVVDRAP
jgi:quercetin dioxygenase-like cupin family protein